MTDGEHRSDRMPETLRVAFTILSVVTVLVGIFAFGFAVFIWSWGGGWLGLLPFAPLIIYATITVLVMNRKAWARFATPLFPIAFAIVAASATPSNKLPFLLAAAALTTLAVVLVFVPSSCAYFTQRQIVSSGDLPQ